MNVFDASALLAYLHGEVGTDVVRERLFEGGACGAANWAEVAQKVRAVDAEWDAARTLLLSYELVVEPVTRADAELAAAMWRPGQGLSLGDRLCLALTAPRRDRLDSGRGMAGPARGRPHSIGAERLRQRITVTSPADASSRARCAAARPACQARSGAVGAQRGA